MKNTSDEPLAGASDETLMALIKSAGPRARVPDALAERARLNVREHWQGVVRARSRRRYRLAAAAAVAALALALGARFVFDEPAALGVASIERSVGAVRIAGTADGSASLLAAQTDIETAADGGLALRLVGGASLRVAANSRLTLMSGNRAALHRGRVYIDSGPGAASVEILTPLGVMRDIGTQFQVRFDDDRLIVGVREGAVAIERVGADSLVAPSGVFVRIEDRAPVADEIVAPTDARWDWAENLAPVFDTDGATLFEFLTFYARESGLSLVMADAVAERARRHRFDGQLGTTSLDAMLDEARALFSFDAVVDGEQLIVTMP